MRRPCAEGINYIRRGFSRWIRCGGEWIQGGEEGEQIQGEGTVE